METWLVCLPEGLHIIPQHLLHGGDGGLDFSLCFSRVGYGETTAKSVMEREQLCPPGRALSLARWAKNNLKHLGDHAGEGGDAGGGSSGFGRVLIYTAESALRGETGEQGAPGSEESQQLVL